MGGEVLQGSVLGLVLFNFFTHERPLGRGKHKHSVMVLTDK